MLDFWNSVVEFFELIGRFLIMSVMNLISAISFLSGAMTTMSLILGYMPMIIGGACLAFVSIGVIRFLLMK